MTNLPDYARFKAWNVKDNSYTQARIDAGDYWSLAAYSVEAQTKRLNKEDKRRLMLLMDSDIYINNYVKDVGFKTPYRYSRHPGDEFVYIVDSSKRAAPAKESDASRPLLYVRKVKTMPQHYLIKWIAGQGSSAANRAEQFEMYSRHENVKAVYADRLTKKDMLKIDLLNLMEERSYLDGVGIWRYKNYYPFKDAAKCYILDCLD